MNSRWPYRTMNALYAIWMAEEAVGPTVLTKFGIRAIHDGSQPTRELASRPHPRRDHPHPAL
jgi:hypothetical protein